MSEFAQVIVLKYEIAVLCDFNVQFDIESESKVMDINSLWNLSHNSAARFSHLVREGLKDLQASLNYFTDH